MSREIYILKDMCKTVSEARKAKNVSVQTRYSGRTLVITAANLEDYEVVLVKKSDTLGGMNVTQEAPQPTDIITALFEDWMSNRK